MLRNYIKIAFRNLSNNKIYSAINILGLSSGMAVALLIGIWVADELQFNHYHPHPERLAQIKTTQTFNGTTGTSDAVAIPMGLELRARYSSDFRNVSLASWNFTQILSVGEKKVAKSGMWVEKPFPQMFGLRMVAGPVRSLDDPTSIYLSQSVARTLFGNQQALGKVVRLNNKLDFQVTGVYEDLPFSSSFHETRYLLPWKKYIDSENWLKDAMTQWDNHSFQLYVEIQPNANPGVLAKKIRLIPQAHVTVGNEESVLHTMDRWHLYSQFTNGKEDGGRIDYVILFSTIGAFVLLLACINFMNLATARSEKRSREVGIRKALGSLRKDLVVQFLTESLVVAFIALLISLVVVMVSLPAFNELAGKQARIPWSEPAFWLALAGFTVFTGLISGSYPAFYLSGFNPIAVLKGTFKSGRFSALPRKILVVIQFTVSISLIIGTLIVFRQIEHAKNRTVGYNRDGLVYTQMTTPEIFGKYNVLRSDLLATGVVADMCESLSPTTEIWSNQVGFDWNGKDPRFVPLFCIVSVTHDYGNTIRREILKGRDFSRDFPSDTGALILNEAAVRLTGFKNPVGQVIRWNDKDRRVVGVVRDMVIQSPYEPVKPTLFFLDYGWSNVITLRVKPESGMRDALARIEPVFRLHNPSSPFEYNFVSEEYDRKFSDEEKIGKLARVFAGLAVFISCLGLFGLASFVSEQRTKEIGVRKVLGASVFGIWRTLSRDFMVLILISCVIAVPFAWFELTKWLENFQYRTPLTTGLFLVPAIGAMAVTLITVSYQSFRAALSNPVKSLRTE